MIGAILAIHGGPAALAPTSTATASTTAIAATSTAAAIVATATTAATSSVAATAATAAVVSTAATTAAAPTLLLHVIQHLKQAPLRPSRRIEAGTAPPRDQFPRSHRESGSRENSPSKINASPRLLKLPQAFLTRPSYCFLFRPNYIEVFRQIGVFRKLASTQLPRHATEQSNSPRHTKNQSPIAT
jgi:hypothetical protein